ncbi:hypothetical protein DXG03_008783 [Asterophora parasitica]|uniref:Uncharacterized protein n=1 Tax=Asterophora parasitica TaxID=117018 RepID=A0A9P7FYI7_9AGAR|nr:hypothetical protein DXG03_008783 [Asterophora parasitica]
MALLYEHLPQKFHFHLEKLSAFQDGFLHQQQQAQLTAFAELCKYGAIIFKGLNIPAACWKCQHTCTAKEACIKLLCWNTTPGLVTGNHKYDLYPPIVYLDYQRSGAAMYRHPALIKVCTQYMYVIFICNII